jgi:cell division protein FtsQ
VKGKRRKPSPAARIRPFWLPIGLAVIVAAVVLVFFATYPGFDPQRVSVSGNSRVSRQEILTRAAVAPQTTIWLQNTGAIAQRISAIPYIDKAHVRRIPPATIRIVVTERTPFAQLRSGYDTEVVDRSLRVLEPAATESALPVFNLEPGIDLTPGSFVRSPAAVALRKAFETMVSRQITPVELGFDRYGGLVVTLRGGLRLLLGGQNDLAQKLTLADAILSQIVTRKGRVAAIDLRAPAAPVLVYR